MHPDQAAKLQSLLRRLAHEGVARVIRTSLKHGIDPDEKLVAKVIDEDAGLQLVIFLAPWDGPPRLILNPGVTLEDLLNPIKPPLPFPLRDVEDAAMKAAPGPTERPVSIRALARRAGYSDTGHWREAVNQLVDRGLLVRVRGGVRRANLPGESARDNGRET